MQSDQGMILGDFNTTLDPKKDRKGYLTDNHKKSRVVLSTWLESEELVDVLRVFEPEKEVHTFRTKDNSKSGRLDYVLATPNLIPNITSFVHKYMGYDHSDHSATLLHIDFEKSEQGPGVFRAHPSLLKYPSYKTQIMSAIRLKILESISNKKSPTYISNLQLALENDELEKRIALLKTDPNLYTDPQIKELELRIKVNNSLEDTIECLLQQELTTQPEFLLDAVVNEMKLVTQKFSKSLKLARHDKYEALNNKLIELNNIVDNIDTKTKLSNLEIELKLLTDDILQDEASVHRNSHLLNDCKITPQFLALEKRKSGYSNIVRLTNSKGDITTNPPEIRSEMTKFYQQIYKKQTLNHSTNSIEDFLTSDKDIDPLREAKSRKIPENLRNELETELTKEELTTALMKNMKPNSAPGIDGFSVKFVREF